MSKKSLLNEGTIRRFMKLAEIEPLTNPFIQRLDEAPEDEAEEMEVDLDAAEDEGAEDFDLDLDADEAEGEMDLELDVDEEGGEEDDPMKTLADELNDVLMQKLEDMVEDGTLEISDGEEAEDVDLEAAAEEGEVEVDVEDEDVDLDAADVDVEASEEEIVAEVARRVAKRILSARS